MPVRIIRGLLLTLVLFIFVLPSAAAQDGSKANPLLALLAVVANTPVVREGLQPSYVDYRAGEAAGGISAPENSAAFLASAPEIQRRWVEVTQRFRTGPRLDTLAQYLSEMPDLVGLDWFAVDRALVYGSPPTMGTVFSAQYDAGSMAAALGARGFERSELDEIAVWHRFEDSAVNIAERAPGDPFGGDLGRSARVALLPGYVVNAAVWDVTVDAIDAHLGNLPTLADNPDYRALAESLFAAGAEGRLLIQAAYFRPDDIGNQVVIGLDGREQIPEGLADFGALPRYNLALLADAQEGGQQVHIIAAVYDDAASAEAAVAEIGERMTGFDPFERYEPLGVTFDAPQVFVDSVAGRAVALVSLRYASPAAPTDGSQPIQPGLIFATWLRAVQERAFRPLALVE